MIARAVLIASMLMTGKAAQGQDVPGIELCTRETNMDRRTGCLQSNIDYLHKLIVKNAASAQQKLDAATAEIAALRAAVANLQTSLDRRQAQPKPDPSASKPDAKQE